MSRFLEDVERDIRQIGDLDLLLALAGWTFWLVVPVLRQGRCGRNSGAC